MSTSRGVLGPSRSRLGIRDRLGGRLSVAVLLALPAAAAASLIAVAVESEWNPFRTLDQSTANHLHTQALAHPTWTRILADISTVGGPTTFRVLVGLAVVVLWIRGARRLAWWAATTMVAGAILDTGVKDLVNRTRPLLPNPVAHAPGASFPSGHALTATLGLGLLVLIVVPVLGRTGRAAAWTLAAVIDLAIGYSRVGLGVHWVTDVVGGWLLAVALLAATTSAFETWRSEHGLRPARPTVEGPAPEESAEAFPRTGGRS